MAEGPPRQTIPAIGTERAFASWCCNRFGARYVAKWSGRFDWICSLGAFWAEFEMAWTLDGCVWLKATARLVDTSW